MYSNASCCEFFEKEAKQILRGKPRADNVDSSNSCVVGPWMISSLGFEDFYQ